MSDTTPTSLAAAVAPRAGKSLKIVSVFLKEEKICYKIVFKLSQSSEIVLQSWNQSSEIVLQSWNLHRRKTDFCERSLTLKG